MDISGLNTTAPPLGATQSTFTSSRTKIVDDIKSSNPTQAHTDEIGKHPKELNSHINKLQTSMGFVLNKGLSDQIVAVIKNRKTGEIMKFVPSEEQLKIQMKMANSTGMLLDQIV